MKEEVFDEFVKFINYVKKLEKQGELELREITEEDLKYLKGDCFRGVTLFMFILSLYLTGKANVSLQGSRVFTGKREIEVRQALATPHLGVAVGYANSHSKGNTEEKYGFLLKDNEDKKVSLPDSLPKAMKYPFVIAFTGALFRYFEYKEWEGNAPYYIDRSTILELLKILKLDENKFKRMFPILYGILIDLTKDEEKSKS